MKVAEMLKKYREDVGNSLPELAMKAGIPVDLIAYIEDPVAAEAAIIKLLAEWLGISPAVFKGEKPPKPREPSPEEKRAALVQNALFPCIRRFILDNL